MDIISIFKLDHLILKVDTISSKFLMDTQQEVLGL